MDQAALLIPILRTIGDRIGLPFPIDKGLVLSDAATEIAHVSCSPNWELKLGVLMRVYCGSLQMRCVCKSSDKLQYVSNFSVVSEPPPTRSMLSAFTGVIQASNILNCHPAKGFLCSLLSRYGSKVEPVGQWNVPLKFTEAEKTLINKLVKLLQKEMNGIGSTQACIHGSVKYDDCVLTLTSDASLEGYGFCIASARDDIIIKSSAKPWNPRHHGASWHSNRRELYAFFQCATAADPIIRGSVKGRLLEVRCYIDNEASLSWLRKGCPSVKGMERVAVRRLVSTIRDLLLSWEEDCHVKISLIHIEGSKNQRVDSYSRMMFFYRIQSLVNTMESTMPSLDDNLVIASSSIRSDEPDNVQSQMTIDGMNLGGELHKLVSDQTRAQLDQDDTCWNGVPLMAMVRTGVPDSLLSRFQVVNTAEYMFLVLNTKLGTRIYVPPDRGEYELRSRLLSLAHDPVSHNSALQMKIKLGRHFWWPGMMSSCAEAVRSCLGCDMERQRHVRGTGFSETVVTKRFQVLFIDFAGPCDAWFYYDPVTGVSLQNCSVCIMMDGCSNYVELVVCKSQDVSTTVSLIIDHWIRRYGIPSVIRSDRGSSFCSRVMKALYNKLHIEHRSSAGHHAESQGQVEAVVKLVKRLLERLVTSNLNVVPLLQRSINTLVRYPSVSSEISWTPEVLLYGEATQRPLEILLESDQFRYYDGLLPSEQPNEVAAEVKDIVSQFCEAWSQEVSIIRAKGVDRLNAKGGISRSDLVDSLSEGALVFRVLRDGLGHSKCTGPFIVEKLEDNNRLKVYGMDTFIPLHQVRLCHSDPNSAQGCGFEIVQPDPHGLLSRPRDQIPVGATIMFLVVEWYDDKETWCYDLAIVKRNVYPRFFVRRLLMDDANQWSDGGARYNIWIHSSQIIGEVQLTSRGRITQVCRKKLQKAGIPA